LRNRIWLTLAFIVVLAVVSGWISLPGSDFDIAGFRAAHPVRRGLDLQGGLQVVLEARPVAGQTIDRGTLEGTRQTLERRVNGLGVSEPLIQTRGNDQVIIELPGVNDPQEAIGILQQTALLEIIDPLGQYLPPGTEVNTTLGRRPRCGGGCTERDAFGDSSGRDPSTRCSDPNRSGLPNCHQRR
jgi:preprotein translocase subunit SecD